MFGECELSSWAMVNLGFWSDVALDLDPKWVLRWLPLLVAVLVWYLFSKVKSK